MGKISYKFVKNESYQILKKICKTNIAYLKIYISKIRLKMIEPTKLYWLEVTSYKHL
jgi:hypothetical protein